MQADWNITNHPTALGMPTVFLSLPSSLPLLSPLSPSPPLPGLSSFLSPFPLPLSLSFQNESL